MAQHDTADQADQDGGDAVEPQGIQGKWQIPLLALGALCFVGALSFAVLKPPSKDVSPQRILQEAEAALAEGQYVRADEICEQFLRDYPTHRAAAQVHEIQGDANYALGLRGDANHGDYLRKAVAAFSDANEPRPGRLRSPLLLAKLGRTYLRLGDWEKAIGCYDMALDSAPPNPLELHLAKIDAWRSTKETENLKLALAEVATLRKTLGDLDAEQQSAVALQEARILNELGEYVAAEKTLRAMLDSAAEGRRPTRFLVELARTQLLAGRPTVALDTLREAIDTPTLTDEDEVVRSQAFLLTAQVYIAMAHYDKALHWYTRAATEYPESDESLAARLGIAEAYLMMGEVDSAGEAYGKVAEDLRALPLGGTPWINIEASRAALRQQSELSNLKGDYREALRFVMLEESILVNADRDVRLRRAMTLSRFARSLDAEAKAAPAEALRQAKRLEAEKAWREAGDTFVYVAEQFDGATQQEFPDDIWNAIECYRLAGDHTRAVAELTRFIKTSPMDVRVPNAQLELARQYEVLGQWNEAIEALKQLKARAGATPTGVEGTYLMGKALVRKGPDFFEQAEEQFLEVVDSANVAPRSLGYRKSLLELGRLMHRRGDYDRAILRLSEFIQRYPESPETLSARYLLASSLRHQGLRALAQYHKAVRLVDKEAYRQVHRQKLQAAIDAYRGLSRQYDALPVPLSRLQRQEHRGILFDLADSLYELGRTEEAIRAYNIIIYRYESDPCVMAAYVQLANIFQTLGRADRFEAILERAYWTLEKIPAPVFVARFGGASKGYWQNWLRAMRVR